MLTQENPPGLHIPSAAQLLLGAAGFVLSAGAAAVMLAVGVYLLFRNTSSDLELLSVFSGAWQGIVIALLMIPSIGFAGFRLMGKMHHRQSPDTNMPSVILSTAAILAWPMIIAVGSIVLDRSFWVWAVLPPIQSLAVILPLWWFYEQGSRQLPTGSGQRRWGILNISLWVTPLALIILEILIVGMLLLLLAVWLAVRPELVHELEKISLSVSAAGMDPESLGRLAQTYFRHPMVVWAALVFFSCLIPLVEELVKPMAVWFLLPRNISPAEGFVAGLISGSGFALVESLGMLAQAGDSGWAVLVTGRMGTGLLHMTTTGLMGWGLAAAWKDGNPIQMGCVYLISVTLHGLWNGFAILFGLRLLLPLDGMEASIFTSLIIISPMVLPWLGFILFVLLIGTHRILNREPKI